MSTLFLKFFMFFVVSFLNFKKVAIFRIKDPFCVLQATEQCNYQ